MASVEEIKNDSNYIVCLDHGFVGLVDHLGSDESIDRAARVSYGGGTRKVSETRGLIRYLMKHRHTSPFEMAVVTFHIKLPIFVMRQLIRHRTACLSGDVSLYFDGPYSVKNNKFAAKPKTIAEFYNLWHNGVKCISNKSRYSIKQLEKLEIIDDDIYYNIKQLSKLLNISESSILSKIRSGLISSTKNKYGHNQILGSDYKNGIKEYNRIKSDEYIEHNMSIRSRLKEMYIRSCDENTKEITHTRVTDIWQNGIKPMYRVTLENGYSIKMTVDHLCYTNNGWFTMKDAIGLVTDEKTHKVKYWKNDINLFGTNGFIPYQDKEWLQDKVNNSMTNNSMTMDENNIRIDLPPKPTSHGHIPWNKTLCRFVKVNNVEYVGDEMSYDISVEGPFHNFVANGFIVHNSINEYSGRYSIMSDEFYIPELEKIQTQSTDNKQGRSSVIDPNIGSRIQNTMKSQFENDYGVYKSLLGEEGIMEFVDESGEFPGIARELARVVLPVSNYTECYWTHDIHNLFHLLKLRMDSHAQWEIRVFANAMYNLIKPLYPLAVEAFEDYVLHGSYLSRMDSDLLTDLMSISSQNNKGIKQSFDEMVSTITEKELQKKYKLSQREWTEFIQKWKLN